MGSKTGITWASSTWNPWQGCHRVSPGCLNCYMHREKQRYGQDPSHIHRSSDATVRSILSPQKFTPGSKVFVCSWSDFFLPEADAWRSEAWSMIGARRDLTFLLLTKRPQAMADRLPQGWPWRHVWLGVTCEDQARADERIPVLLATPAAGWFVSVEPMLGPVGLIRWLDPTGITCSDVCPDVSYILPNEVESVVHDGERWPICPNCGEVAEFTGYNSEPRLGYVIAGGETGPNARPMNHEWLRSLRDQCAEAVCGFHFKSWGSHGDGRLLDGREHNDMPGEVL